MASSLKVTPLTSLQYLLSFSTSCSSLPTSAFLASVCVKLNLISWLCSDTFTQSLEARLMSQSATLIELFSAVSSLSS